MVPKDRDRGHADTDALPRSTLTVLDGVAIIVGMVIGAGIFKTPSLVAANCTSVAEVLLLWLAGGAFCFVGALCYAELTSAYPHPGGDYHYLGRAFGNVPAFLFAWSRITVIQTGSIAMLAFLIGDYASEMGRFGPYSSSLYAAITIIVMTGLNLLGIQQGRWMQNLLTGAIVLGLVAVVALGLLGTSDQTVAGGTAQAEALTTGGVGKALIFVLLTYGGWNEIAYLSSEVRKARRNMVRILLYGIAVITAIYFCVNYVFFEALGFAAVASSEAVAVDLMRAVLGESAVSFISVLVIIAVLSTMNAVIITGSRTNYAFGRDFPLFGFLGKWHGRANTPVNALIFQAIAALGLVGLGTGTRSGFTMMVEYTAPVFWLFFFLVGVGLFVLRRKERAIVRPFRVPLYPFTPLLFCGVSLFMFYSSVAYTGKGGIISLAVLLAGVPFLLIRRPEAEFGQA